MTINAADGKLISYPEMNPETAVEPAECLVSTGSWGLITSLNWLPVDEKLWDPLKSLQITMAFESKGFQMWAGITDDFKVVADLAYDEEVKTIVCR